MLNLIFNPWLRIGILLVLSLSSVGYGIHKLRQDAIAKVEAAATADALRRTQNAINSGDSVDVSPDGLLKSDGHRRD